MPMHLPKVVLTNAIHPDLMPPLQAACEVVLAPDAQPATLARLLGDAQGLIVRAQLAPDVFEHAPQLRYVVRHGVGLDMIPVPAATAKGIVVANLPGSNTTAVVEYVLAALLHFRRGLAAVDTRLRADGWSQARAMGDTSTELAGSVLGIVGVGAIGARVAAAAQGLGLQVLGLTRRPDTLPSGVQGVDKATLFERSDAIALCCPLNAQTRGLVDTAALARMKRHAVLINVARGPVLDTAAVLAALREGRIGGAAMDVHDAQPLTGQEAAFAVPNLLLTPHLAGITATSLRAMSEGAVHTLLALLRGERPANIVNPEVFAQT